eukprot:m.133907 g.133907  ORF g.133907 m.133907 type:complete len:307 (-) comp15962_c0_seq1:19-939(-)
MRISRALSALHKRYTVLTRPVPSSFAQALNDFQNDRDNHIDLEDARQQHDMYTRQINAIPEVARVIAMQPLDDLPDSVFVEDVMVVAGNTAIVTRPGAESRRAEATATHEWLCKHFGELELQRLENFTTDVVISIDGGDVLQVESTIFVGQSTRTNAAALSALQDALPNRTVVPISVPSTTLHLKSIITWLGPGLGYVVEGTSDGHAVAKRIAEVVPGAITSVPSALTANILRIGNTVLYNSQGTNLPLLVKDSLEQQVPRGSPDWMVGLKALEETKWVAMDDCASEIAKADGALTCCCVVIENNT